MKKFSPLALIGVLFLALAPLPELRAQAVAPWFRGTARSWATLKASSFTLDKISRVPLIKPMSGLVTGKQVKTTLPNWLKYRLSHSGAFCKQEKEILSTHSTNTSALIGKLTYFWDRDALLSQSAANAEINPNALARHQQLLLGTLAEAEEYFLEDFPTTIHSYVFSKEDILNLLADPSQPPAYVLARRELEAFPQMTLEEQQNFVRQTLAQNLENLSELLTAGPDKLTTAQYTTYYLLKLRRQYFTLLERVINAAQKPRNTIIIRVKKQIPLPFLPHNESRLTDAQRLGKLYFYADSMRQRGEAGPTEPFIALQAEIARQEKLYQPYAQAEAFNIPYEAVFLHQADIAAYALGPETAERLKALSNIQAIEELPELILQAQAHKNTLLGQTPSGPDFYTHYFRLYLKKNILKTRLARAQFFAKYAP